MLLAAMGRIWGPLTTYHSFYCGLDDMNQLGAPTLADARVRTTGGWGFITMRRLDARRVVVCTRLSGR